MCPESLPVLSPRLQALKGQVQSKYSPVMYAQRREVYARVWHEKPAVAMVLRTAFALAAFLAEKDLPLTTDDLLAGGEQFYDFTLPHLETDYDQETSALMTEFRRGYRVGLYCGGLGGHVIGGYQRVLQQGLGTLASAAAARIEVSAGPAREFAQASLTVCAAASHYALRYAARAEELARTVVAADDRTRLERIAAACRWVSVEPPRTFLEALQLYWLTHEIITCEQVSGSLSLGRFDQVLYPYYTRDIAEGRLTPDEAVELIEAFWVKLAGLKRGFQNVTLGGSDAQGKDVANEITLMALRATRKLRMDQPLLSLRCHPQMGADQWAEVEELLQLGLGFPALFNEQVVVAAKRALGVVESDARDWGVVGCVEPSVPGKEFSHTEGLRVNWAKVLEAMLNNGACALSGEPLPLQQVRNLATITSFDDFYRWYRQEMAHAIDLGIRGMNVLDNAFAERTPYPFLSSTMEGCLQAGRDVTAGSTVYNFCTVNGLGMANVADALVAIRKLVFEEQRVKLPELAQALRDDFAGQEPLRQALLRCPKYGNDQEEPDRILRELAGDFGREVGCHRNARGGRMQHGLYTVDSHGFMGELTGALPDGRRRGLALANALSPSQGSDTSGPTAVVRSCTEVDHSRLGNGMVLDIKFAPGFFAELRRQGVFRPFVEAYFRSGGMEIQFNVIDRATLLAAQRFPQQHRDLVVRVSGFSA